ncbi:MAG: N-acetylglucosamine kinase [Anaerolineae bacterium]
MRYILGVDGGASKTLIGLADEAGNLLAVSRRGSTNYQTASVDAVCQEISEGVREAFARAGIPQRRAAKAWLCLAGLDVPADYKVMREAIAQLGLAERFWLDNDIVGALAGALAGRPGVVVNSGTGAVAIGRDSQGQQHRADGWGHILGDDGSGYDIGQRAMRAAMRSYDGRGPATLLTDKLIAHLALESLEDLVTKVYVEGMSPDQVAALAPLVEEAAQEGDEVARQILRQAGRELAHTALSIMKKLALKGEDAQVATVGGVFTSSLVREAFEEGLGQKAKVVEPRFSPLVGAISLALKELGVEPEEKILAAMEEAAASFLKAES